MQNAHSENENQVQVSDSFHLPGQPSGFYLPSASCFIYWLDEKAGHLQSH